MLRYMVDMIRLVRTIDITKHIIRMNIRLTKTLEGVIARAAFDAEKRDVSDNLTDRLFLKMLEEDCHAVQILKRILKDWELYQLRIRIDNELNGMPGLQDADGEARKAFFKGFAERLAETAGSAVEMLNTGHVLLLVLGDRSYVSARVLEMYHVERAAVEQMMGEMPVEEDYYHDMRNVTFERRIDLTSLSEEVASSDRRKPSEESVLDRLGVNLTEEARAGRIDPVVGRETEIERLIQILGRRKKNNPVLIGEAGVGKSAIVEGLALRIADGKAPFSLRGKQIYSLDVSSLVAGTKFRGEFEERMQALLAELGRRSDVILFIDEIHTIVGAGSTQGSLDTANILKPALARGEIQCIGATTLAEYRENIEKDAALERRFQRILVEPPTREQTLTILRNIKPQYERHHSVRYTDAALQACVDLTERYLTDRSFPDKAIDVLDEAGSKAHLRAAVEPESIARIERGLRQAVADRRRAVSELVYEQAAAARLRELALTTKLDECRTRWERELRMYPVTVDAEQIEEVITLITGIPVEKVSQDEQSRLRGMADHLNSVVVGQADAVERVTRAIQRSRAGLKEAGRPIGVFMFVGPTGVGKTLLAKELARWMFDRRDGLIRIDMSEYSEKHNVARLIGSPPGYVGYGEGGQLTEAVRRHPYSVVLFDEIEKAHSDVFNIMLQIFDEGRLTDGSGRVVDFRNTVIVITSNVGSRAAALRQPRVGYSTPSREEMEQQGDTDAYRQALSRTFAPEFINRIDDIVIFRTLDEQNIERIVDLELENLRRRAEVLGISITVSEGARRRLARMGYEERYGVRSLKRKILDSVEEPMARMIVEGDLSAGDMLAVEDADDGLKLYRRCA